MKQIMTAVLISMTFFNIQARAEEAGCAKAELNFSSSLNEFREAKGAYCQAFEKCGKSFGFPVTTMNVDMTLSVPGGDDSKYDSCMAPTLRELNETAKVLSAWELARCEDQPPEDDVYFLCGNPGAQARGGTANRYLAPLPLHSVANR